MLNSRYILFVVYLYLLYSLNNIVEDLYMLNCKQAMQSKFLVTVKG